MEEVVLVVVVLKMVVVESLRMIVGGNRGKGDSGLWGEGKVVKAVVVAVVWDAVNSGKWCCRWYG